MPTSPKVEAVVPDRRRVSVSVRVRKDGFCPDPRKLKRELSKKYKEYRVKSVGFIAKNPPDYDGSIRLFIVAYLVKEVVGPTAKQMVKDLYRWAKKQMSVKKGGKKLALPPAFIYNGKLQKKTRKKKKPR